MFRSLTALACQRPFSTLTAVATLVGLGLLSLYRLPVSLLPELERPRILVQLSAPGSGAASIVDDFVKPIEPAILALPDVNSLDVTIDVGSARFEIDTEWGTDPTRTAVEVERIFAQTIDSASATYRLEILSGDPGPVLEVAVVSTDGPRRTEFARSVLAPEIAQLEQVGRVELVGLAPLHAVVKPIPSQLLARGLTTSDLVTALGTVGHNLPSGRAQLGAETLPIFISNPVGSVEELEALPLPAHGSVTFLGDVAQVHLEPVPSHGEFRIDGRSATCVQVFRAPGANAVALAGAVRRVTDRLREQAGGLTVRIVDDRSEEVRAALLLLVATIVLSLIVAGGVLWLFHRHWRPTVALIAVVPASLIVSFSLFPLFGMTLNLMSLSGMALAIGLLVDSSVVVLEAVGGRASEGIEAVVDETAKVTPAIAASFLTTAVVFVPLAFLSGLTRTFFLTQAVVLIATLSISLLLSLTLIPMLAGRAPIGDGQAWQPGFGLYRRLRDWSLKRPALLLAATGAVLAAAVVAAAIVPKRLMPAEPVAELEIAYSLPDGLSERRQAEMEADLERSVAGALSAYPVEELRSLRPPLPNDETRPGADVTMVVRLAGLERAEAALSAVDATLAARPALEATVRYRPSHLVEAIERTALTLKTTALGQSQEQADVAVRELLARLEPWLGSRSTWSDSDHRSALKVVPNPGPAGLVAHPERLRASLVDALLRHTAGRLDTAGVSPEVVLKPGARPELTPVRLPDGAVVPFGAIAQLKQVRRPPPLERFGGSWARTVELEPRDASENQELYRALLALDPAGERRVVERGGAVETAEAVGQTRLLLGVAIALVLLTVTAIFESFRSALLVALVVSVGLAGGVLTLWGTGGSLNLVSALGLLLLAGLAANNAIVLIHAFRRHREGLEDRIPAVAAASLERYRPILITTATTVFAMVPLALLGGSGSSLRRSLAVTIIGGMIVSTLAVLFVLPSLLARKRTGE